MSKQKEKQTTLTEAPITDKINQQIYKEWIKIWVQNAFKNYQRVMSRGLSLDLLNDLYQDNYGIYESRPAIVCAPGPSLNLGIPILQKRKKAIVIACLSALPTLIANGIKPDYTIAYDARPGSERFCEGVDTSELALITTTTINPDLVDTWKGPIFFFNQAHIGFEFFDVVLPTVYGHFPSYLNAGCTANMAIIIAGATLGCEPIYMIGIEYPIDNSMPYQTERWTFKNGKWVKEILPPSPIIPEKIEAIKRYRHGLYIIKKHFGDKLINCSPYASFKDELPFKHITEVEL